MVERVDYAVAFFKTHGVNVVHCYLEVTKMLAHHHVADNIFGEHGASRAHEGHFSHSVILAGPFFPTGAFLLSGYRHADNIMCIIH